MNRWFVLWVLFGINAMNFYDRQILAAVMERVPMIKLREDDFLETILARIPPTPPHHAQIVALNEAGAMPEGDPTDLEAGANRCAVG